MVLPIPIPPFVLPVTGVGGNPTPVANMFDAAGNFRNRLGSGAKRKRHDNSDLDDLFDLSQSYPPLVYPEKQKYDIDAIRGMIVAATEAGGAVKTLMAKENLDPDTKLVGNLAMHLLNTLEKIVESGLLPMSISATRKGTAPPLPPKVVNSPGLNELRSALDRADKESVLFGADLGEEPVANRKALTEAFSVGVRAAILKKAGSDADKAKESVRATNDALSCVANMEFLGQRSRKFIGRSDDDVRNNKFCTMPIKLRFEDKDSRLNFERTLRETADLRATMSLPEPIRKEMAAALTAFKGKYKDAFVTVRPDVRMLSFIAHYRGEGERGWTKCAEAIPIPHAIMLPAYKPRERIDLPEVTDLEQYRTLAQVDRTQIKSQLRNGKLNFGALGSVLKTASHQIYQQKITKLIKKSMYQQKIRIILYFCLTLDQIVTARQPRYMTQQKSLKHQGI